MAQVTLRIGNRDHHIGCRDGSEARLAHVSRLLDERWHAASQAAGGINDERTMLFVALMLADALDEAQASAPPPAPAPAPAPPIGATATDDETLSRMADRLEHLANALENRPDNP